jgi:hypothetical protein
MDELKVLILVNDFLGYIAHHLLKDVLLELVGFFFFPSSSSFGGWCDGPIKIAHCKQKLNLGGTPSNQ